MDPEPSWSWPRQAAVPLHVGRWRTVALLTVCCVCLQRSQEVEEASFTPGSGRLSTVSRGRRRRTGGCSKGRSDRCPHCWAKRAFSGLFLADRGRAWFICEGFQVILRVQAEALLTLGVCQDFKVGACISQAQEGGPALTPADLRSDF